MAPSHPDDGCRSRRRRRCRPPPGAPGHPGRQAGLGASGWRARRRPRPRAGSPPAPRGPGPRCCARPGSWTRAGARPRWAVPRPSGRRRGCRGAGRRCGRGRAGKSSAGPRDGFGGRGQPGAHVARLSPRVRLSWPPLWACRPFSGTIRVSCASSRGTRPHPSGRMAPLWRACAPRTVGNSACGGDSAADRRGGSCDRAGAEVHRHGPQTEAYVS